MVAQVSFTNLDKNSLKKRETHISLLLSVGDIVSCKGVSISEGNEITDLIKIGVAEGAHLGECLARLPVNTVLL